MECDRVDGGVIVGMRWFSLMGLTDYGMDNATGVTKKKEMVMRFCAEARWLVFELLFEED